MNLTQGITELSSRITVLLARFCVALFSGICLSGREYFTPRLDDQFYIDHAIEFIVANERSVMVGHQNERGKEIGSRKSVPYKSVAEFKRLNSQCCVTGHISSDSPVPSCVRRPGVTEVSVRWSRKYIDDGEIGSVVKTIHLGVDNEGEVCTGDITL